MTSRPDSNLPLFRLSFARILGTDENGDDQLGRFREIGAIWPRRNGKPGGVVRFDLTPAELATHEGVLMALPIDDDEEPAKQG